jgi:vacuolar protein sorting-associated protein 13A/C
MKGLGVGFFKGITGVIEQPVMGGMRGGAEGFVKGVGRGVVGVVIKPVVSVLDFFNKTTEGIRNVTTIADQHSTGSRRRYPRNIASDGVVEPFSRDRADGCFILY